MRPTGSPEVLERRSVHRWKAAYRKQGELNAQAKAELGGVLLERAKAAGFPTDLWTCPRGV